jgi:hypothetical protein
VTIIDALRDANLLGALPAFADLAPWRSWLCFLKAVYRHALTDAELGIFCQHTARTTP